MPEQKEQQNPLGPFGTPTEGPKEPARRDPKGPKVGRKDILDALKAGAQVAIGADVYRKGLGGRVTPPLPPPPATSDQPDEFSDVVLVRDEHGRLTQEGAEHAIRHGGAVLLGEEAHTSTETLPDLEEYHARVAKGASEALDQQIAALQAQKTQAQQPAKARGEPGASKLRLGGGSSEVKQAEGEGERWHAAQQEAAQTERRQAAEREAQQRQEQAAKELQARNKGGRQSER